MESEIDFPWMRKIFFAKDTFELSGKGTFTGTFHLFRETMPDGRIRTGRELKGTFNSRDRRAQHAALRRPARRGEVGAGVASRSPTRRARSTAAASTSATRWRRSGSPASPPTYTLRRRVSRRQSDDLQRLPRDAGAAPRRHGVGPQSSRVAARRASRTATGEGELQRDAARRRRAADAADSGGADRGAARRPASRSARSATTVRSSRCRSAAR